ncbi:MAG: VWA domain-containing protein [Planctomycetes bacterium]|nr:VWA domain-containing protein [Planctomycetota bacterium]
MHTRTRIIVSLALALGIGTASLASAAPSDETLQGSLEVTPVAAGDLSLRDHRVDVVINNGFATTTVEQVLVNEGAVDLDARWAFPLPKEASLSELSLWIDGAMSIGEVREEREARRIYEEEANAGQDAALAEQENYREYRLSLSRVPAGGEARVRIVYYQPLEIDSGVGRYLYPLTPGNTQDGMNTSFWSLEEKVSGQFSIDVTLKTSFPVDGLHSPSHPQFQAVQMLEGEWRGSVVTNEPALDRDFLLFYRLSPDVPARVELLTYREPGAAEGTFMAVVTPGSDLAPITKGTDWAFLIDVSGSMDGEKLRIVRRGLAKALRSLGPNDRFRLISFNNSATNLTRGWQDATEGNVAAAENLISNLSAGGGTNLFDGIVSAYRALDSDRSTAVVILSDGAANVGATEYRDFVKLARSHDVRLFTFVIGNGANERLLGDLATISGGYAKSVSVLDEIGAHLMLAKDRMSHAALHGVRFELDGATAVYPQLLPSLYLGQQLVVFGRYDATGNREMVVSAKISGEPRRWTIPVELPEVDESNPELERLYALAMISDMEREEWLGELNESELRQGIVDVALRYSLVTDYTSMVVVREDRRELYGLGHENAERRAREVKASDARAAQGSTVRVSQGSDPLAGSRASHAPTRSRGGGIGAVSPWFVLAIALLALVASHEVTCRDERAASGSKRG